MFAAITMGKFLRFFDKVWKRLAEVNAGVPEDEVAADVRDARHLVRISQDLQKSGITAGELFRESRDELEARANRIIENLQGSLKGGNALQRLMEERKKDREREDRKRG